MHHHYNIVYKHLVIHGVDLENHLDGRKEELESLVEDTETPLYPGCKAFTNTSVSVAMFKHRLHIIYWTVVLMNS